MDIRRIDETISVAPQIALEDVAAIKAAGFTTIINNRPDNEEPGQPGDEALADAAEAAGLGYFAIPVTHAGFTWTQVRATIDVLAHAGGPVLAFCRSGTRSCNLWALAGATQGRDHDALAAAAAAAGYDIAGLRPLMASLAPDADGPGD